MISTGFPLHGVVPSTKLAGVHQHAQNLHVVFGRDARGDHADDEEADAAKQRVHQREDRPAGDERDEEQPPLCAQNGQRAVHRFIDFVLPWTALRHIRPPLCLPSACCGCVLPLFPL